MKLALTAASLLLVAGGAVACGSDDDSSASDSGSDSGGGGGTSTEEFCSAFGDFATSSFSGGISDPAALVKQLKEEADKLEDVGTPDDMPDRAKEGLEVVLDAIDDLPDDADQADLAKIDEQLSDEDEAKGEEFSTWVSDNCPDLGSPGAPAPVPSAPSAPASDDAVDPGASPSS
jgi:hypothetical protein